MSPLILLEMQSTHMASRVGLMHGSTPGCGKVSTSVFSSVIEYKRYQAQECIGVTSRIRAPEIINSVRLRSNKDTPAEVKSLKWRGPSLKERGYRSPVKREHLNHSQAWP